MSVPLLMVRVLFEDGTTIHEYTVQSVTVSTFTANTNMVADSFHEGNITPERKGTRMKVMLISRHPVVTVAKADGRARRGQRGVRKGRHTIRTHVSRGAARHRWVVARDDGTMLAAYGVFRTIKDAERRARQLESAAKRAHPSVRAFMLAP